MSVLAQVTTYRPAPGLMVAAILRAAASPAADAGATVLLFRQPEPVEADTFWTDQRKADLRRLFLIEGLSFALIAKRMGVTRNRVMGKAYRMGLERAEPARVIERITGRIVPLRAKKQSARPPRVAPAAPVVIEDPCIGVTLAAVKGCRWPIGERADGTHLFCDAGREAGPYCCAHTRKAYRR